ncbi:MAG: hypothetical protein LZF63_01940, partial [Nitrosomonas sp.]|nr:hypothetical protein [Nitrosomonas sp.]
MTSILQRIKLEEHCKVPLRDGRKDALVGQGEVVRQAFPFYGLFIHSTAVLDIRHYGIGVTEVRLHDGAKVGMPVEIGKVAHEIAPIFQHDELV